MDPTKKIRNKQQYEQRRHLLREAWQVFEDSERILNLLRTASSARIEEPTDEEILEWYNRIRTKQCK